MFLSRLSLIAFFFSFLMMRCHGNTDTNNGDDQFKTDLLRTNTDTSLQGISHPLSGIEFDSNQVERFLVKFPEFRDYSREFRNFYRSRSYNYAWYDDQGLIEPAHVLLAHLQTSDSIGLPMKIPYRDTLQKLFHYDDHAEDLNHLKPDITSELLLTGQYFHYAKVKYGQRLSASQEDLQWYLPRKKLNYEQLLEKTLAGEDVDKVAEGEMNRQFNALRKELKRYRDIAGTNPDPLEPISVSKPLKPGDSSSAVIAVRKRLHLYGFLSSAEGNDIYDKNLGVAVNRYKKTQGMKQDSLVTGEMAASLNVPVRKRIEQLLTNMERFRWMPKIPHEGEFIFVNIPEYRLHYFESGKNTWDCNVVVGKPMNKTVIFSGDIKHVVFSPYWYVPPSIVSKEVRPGMNRNPNYLASHHMEWNGGNVRQKPGPANSLGLVKFIFPNSNNIYLHDTPSKSLFNEDNRAFSHGCVRVGEPKALAIRILRDEPAWTPEKIGTAMNSGVEKFVPVKKKLPVLIGYFTAFIDKDGDLNFRKDIYGRDDRLFSMISGSK
ncbi:MAG TPA: L,D-transpeptidase family protein [Chitinophagaceae bacterium]|nr:L,D-transpeptidase family protein [Chitinophagaceae bacterium]